MTWRRTPARAEVGRGPRYFRLQIRLEHAIALDDAGPEVLAADLPAAAALIADRDADFDEIADVPLPVGPPSALRELVLELADRHAEFARDVPERTRGAIGEVVL